MYNYILPAEKPWLQLTHYNILKCEVGSYDWITVNVYLGVLYLQ